MKTVEDMDSDNFINARIRPFHDTDQVWTKTQLTGGILTENRWLYSERLPRDPPDFMDHRPLPDCDYVNPSKDHPSYNPQSFSSTGVGGPWNPEIFEYLLINSNVRWWTIFNFLFSQCMKMTVLVEITIINMVTLGIHSQKTILMKTIFTKLFIFYLYLVNKSTQA